MRIIHWYFCISAKIERHFRLGKEREIISGSICASLWEGIGDGYYAFTMLHNYTYMSRLRLRLKTVIYLANKIHDRKSG